MPVSLCAWLDIFPVPPYPSSLLSFLSLKTFHLSYNFSILHSFHLSVLSDFSYFGQLLFLSHMLPILHPFHPFCPLTLPLLCPAAVSLTSIPYSSSHPSFLSLFTSHTLSSCFSHLLLLSFLSHSTLRIFSSTVSPSYCPLAIFYIHLPHCLSFPLSITLSFVTSLLSSPTSSYSFSPIPSDFLFCSYNCSLWR